MARLGRGQPNQAIALSAPIVRIIDRPDTGQIIRPDTGTIARPDTGIVLRP